MATATTTTRGIVDATRRGTRERDSLGKSATTTTTTMMMGRRRHRAGRRARGARRGPREARAGFDLGKLASVLRKKTAMDVERVFSGTAKTRERLSAVNDVLALWRHGGFRRRAGGAGGDAAGGGFRAEGGDAE